MLSPFAEDGVLFEVVAAGDLCTTDGDNVVLVLLCCLQVVHLVLALPLFTFCLFNFHFFNKAIVRS